MKGSRELERKGLSEWGFIKDPIFGYIRLTDTERKVIDTLPVQRLRRIKQLPGAEYVYPAANHTRFEHALGTMYLAGALGESLPVQLSRDDRQLLRLAALLHDVGHGPFSHAFEPVLKKYLGKTHEEMTTWVIKESELSTIIDSEGFDSRKLSTLAVGRLENPPQPFYNQFVRSSVDVDKMDFLLRDSYHAGAGYGSIDIFRLIYTMDVLDGNLAVDMTALPTLESFILGRLESFRAIYFHRTSRAAQIMLLSALEAARDDVVIPNLKSIDDYLKLNDFAVWSALIQNERSSPIMRDLERRKLLKCAYERTFFARDELVSAVFTKETVRSKIEEEIAETAKVDRGDVAIDVPSLPSVPYHYAIEIAPMDIPVFSKTRTGEKVAQRIGELSRIAEVLTAFMNIVRVYTSEENREKVANAANRVLGESPLSSVVSY
jgi:HD superfamily phosphohydrolase